MKHILAILRVGFDLAACDAGRVDREDAPAPPCFRVQGSGLRVRVQGSGFRVQGSGFRVSG